MSKKSNESSDELEFSFDQEIISLSDQPIAAPEIVQNYVFKRHFGQIEAEFSSSTPVGPAADQCWLFTIENNRITNNQKQVPRQSEKIQKGNCVKVTSRTLELAQGGKPGKASWVICCKKDDKNKCHDCTTAVNLQVQVPDLNKPNPIMKSVVISCIP